jgi:hypothetical protein
VCHDVASCGTAMVQYVMWCCAVLQSCCSHAAVHYIAVLQRRVVESQGHSTGFGGAAPVGIPHAKRPSPNTHVSTG